MIYTMEKLYELYAKYTDGKYPLIQIAISLVVLCASSSCDV